MGEATYAAEFFRWFSEEASRMPGRLPTGPQRRQDDHRRPPADGRRLHDHAVELPGGDGDPQARARPGGRLHGGPQAGRGDAADGAVDGGGPAAGRCPGRSGQRRHDVRAGPGVRGDPGRPAYGHAVLHRLDLGRQAAARADRDRVPCPRRWSWAATRRSSCSRARTSTAAVDGAMVAKMRNGGSACTAANRFYVHESLAAEFTDALRARVRRPEDRQRPRPGQRPRRHGVSTRERDKILDLLEEAAEEGGRAPGRRPRLPTTGAFIAPYVVRDVVHGQTLTRNEIFGPGRPDRDGREHRRGRGDGQRHRVRADLLRLRRRRG